MPLGRARAPFDHAEWLFEIKHDGFRALLYSDNTGVRLVSRNGNTFKSFPGLCDGLMRDLRGRRCVLDGEIVCLDGQGRSQFRDLLFHRAEPRFYAFDVLWDQHARTDDEVERRRFHNAEDTRYLPLADRKQRLRVIVPRKAERLLFVDHIDEYGTGFFRLACDHDLEGIVAKWKGAPYLPDQPSSWLKIRNRNYSQWAGREELFERERGVTPDAMPDWSGCVTACDHLLAFEAAE